VIEVRVARPEEFEEVGRVTALAYREFVRPGDGPWEDYLAHIEDIESRAHRAHVLVAIEEGRILGSATLELTVRIDDDSPPLAPREAHVRMLGVDPDARERGVATALMDACGDEARGRGKTSLSLNTTQRMKVAKRMYESLGFARGEDRVFADGFVLLSYSKEL
jgi:ribosomal protein S18 acetylase RimI-like enzyme